MAEQILSRLITAIQLVRGIGRGRNAEICNKTGYSPSHVSGVMNGKVALDDKFIRAVCREYSISEKWVIFGEGEVIAVPEEYPHGIDKFKQVAAQAATISKDKPMPYGVTTVVEGKRITPKEERLLEIIRSSPEAASIVEMLGAMDSDTRKDVQLGVQKEKLLRELLKEKAERDVA